LHGLLGGALTVVVGFTGIILPPRNSLASDGGMCVSSATCWEAEQETDAEVVPSAVVDDVAGFRVVSVDAPSSLFEHAPIIAPPSATPAPRASRNIAAVGSRIARFDGASARGSATPDGGRRAGFLRIGAS
jgi:hypothetical protein